MKIYNLGADETMLMNVPHKYVRHEATKDISIVINSIFKQKDSFKTFIFKIRASKIKHE